MIMSPLAAYTLSINHGVPSIIFLLPVLSITFIIATSFLNEFCKERSKSLYIILILLLGLTFSIMSCYPFLRGVAFMEGSGDSFTQLGELNILWQIGHDRSYEPIIMIFTVVLSMISGADLLASFNIFIPLIQMCLIIMIFNLGRMIFKNNFFAFLAASLFSYTKWGILDFSIAWSTSLLLFFYLILLFLRGIKSNKNILLLFIIITGCILSHPLTGFISVLFLFSIVIFQYISIDHNISYSIRKNALVLLFSVFIFYDWNVLILTHYFRSMTYPLVNLFLNDFSPPQNGSLTNFNSYGLTLIDIIYLFIINYLNWIIFVLVFITTGIIILRRFKRFDNIDQKMFWLSGGIITTGLAFILALSANVIYGIDFAPQRIMAYVLIFSSIYIAYLLLRFKPILRLQLYNKKLFLLVIVLLIFFGSSYFVFSSYNSPEFNKIRSNEVLPSQITGIVWLQYHFGGEFLYSIYGDTRIMDAFYFNYYKNVTTINYGIQISFNNSSPEWYNDPALHDKPVITLILTKGRIMRNILMPIPKDLTFSYDEFSKSYSKYTSLIYYNGGIYFFRFLTQGHFIRLLPQ